MWEAVAEDQEAGATGLGVWVAAAVALAVAEAGLVVGQAA